MASVDIKNLNNEVVGQLELADAVFAGPVNVGLMHQAVKQYLASRRAGTHNTKTRAEVQGSGKKPWRQKGTGRARVGEIRNPLWRKGGIVFGPRPRDYEYHLPKKMFRAALKSALALKLKENQLNVIEAFSLENHKTKPFAQALAKLGFDRKVLLVDHQENQNLWLAARIVKISGRLRRPWPDLANLTLPAASSGLLAAAIAGSFLPDLFGILSGAFAASLLMAFAMLGLAVLHAITRGSSSRAVVLAAVYAATIVLGWPLLALSLLGLAEAAFNIRNRVARKRGPPALRP